MVTRYQKRISGPMLDRIDIHIEVPRVEYDKLSDQRTGETSAAIRQRVDNARARQLERFGKMESDSGLLTCNADVRAADMRPAQVRQFCHLDETCNQLMRSAMRQMQLSARAYHRVHKLARTIADLAGDETITPHST